MDKRHHRRESSSRDERKEAKEQEKKAKKAREKEKEREKEREKQEKEKEKEEKEKEKEKEKEEKEKEKEKEGKEKPKKSTHKVQWELWLRKVSSIPSKFDGHSVYFHWRRGSKANSGNSMRVLAGNGEASWEEKIMFDCSVDYDAEGKVSGEKQLSLKLRDDQGKGGLIGETKLDLCKFTTDTGAKLHTATFIKRDLLLMFRIKATLLRVDNKRVVRQLTEGEESEVTKKGKRKSLLLEHGSRIFVLTATDTNLSDPAFDSESDTEDLLTVGDDEGRSPRRRAGSRKVHRIKSDPNGTKSKRLSPHQDDPSRRELKKFKYQFNSLKAKYDASVSKVEGYEELIESLEKQVNHLRVQNKLYKKKQAEFDSVSTSNQTGADTSLVKDLEKLRLHNVELTKENKKLHSLLVGKRSDSPPSSSRTHKSSSKKTAYAAPEDSQHEGDPLTHSPTPSPVPTLPLIALTSSGGTFRSPRFASLPIIRSTGSHSEEASSRGGDYIDDVSVRGGAGGAGEGGGVGGGSGEGAGMGGGGGGGGGGGTDGRNDAAALDQQLMQLHIALLTCENSSKSLWPIPASLTPSSSIPSPPVTPSSSSRAPNVYYDVLSNGLQELSLFPPRTPALERKLTSFFQSLIPSLGTIAPSVVSSVSLLSCFHQVKSARQLLGSSFDTSKMDSLLYQIASYCNFAFVSQFQRHIPSIFFLDPKLQSSRSLLSVDDLIRILQVLLANSSSYSFPRETFAALLSSLLSSLDRAVLLQLMTAPAISAVSSFNVKIAVSQIETWLSSTPFSSISCFPLSSEAATVLSLDKALLLDPSIIEAVAPTLSVATLYRVVANCKADDVFPSGVAVEVVSTLRDLVPKSELARPPSFSPLVFDEANPLTMSR